MNVLGIIFAYAEKDNLRELTKPRTLASLPIGGKYRMIDFILSNFVNSNIFDVSIITKNNYHSLIDHVGSGKEWDLTRKIGGLRVLTPFASPDAKGNGIYNSRVEALAANMNSIKASRAEYVIMTGCSTIYNIDFEALLKFHMDRNADITAVYTNTVEDPTLLAYDAPYYNINESSRIENVRLFSEENSRRTDDFRTNSDDQRIDQRSYGLGIFVIKKSLLDSLIADAIPYGRLDFYKDILQRLSGSLNIQGYEYRKFFMGIDSISSYMRANLRLLDVDVRNRVFENVVYTKVKDSVPAEYVAGCSVKNSIISDGCRIEGTIENCVLSRGVKIAKGSIVRNSVIMQNTTIMENVNLNYVILDKDVIVRENRKLSGHETFPVVIEKATIV